MTFVDGEPLEPLVLDLVSYVNRERRSYQEVMECWRTSCPRLPVWEDAIDCGYVAVRTGMAGRIVVATPAGIEALNRAGRC